MLQCALAVDNFFLFFYHMLTFILKGQGAVKLDCLITKPYNGERGPV